ncbi:TldD/PmbA family protein [Acidaminobacter sp. JC074]|uniref:TldD/PmbA family protein n=1 Tax=Acidaminobacter sp. JC074 TaxID=2530199 RepID=UPI001F1084E2|nr:TldD/PmbA family protein [Acidaminobacter sp. JC074]MCH4887997.1 TldD/PmbA family protein [Acidaminobacter sp. JC074]
MLKKLKDALSDEGYQDLRFEKLKNLSINIRNDEVKSVEIIEKEGGHARALVGGGFGTLSFNKLDHAKESIASCLVFSKEIPGSMTLAPAPLVEDEVVLSIEMDPRDLTLDEKVDLLRSYGKMASEVPGLSICDIEYIELYKEKYYVNNEGTQIRQEQMSVAANFRMTSKNDKLTQQTRLSLGGGANFKEIMNQDQAVMQKARQTVDLLDAEPVIAGDYDVVLDPTVGGLFIHEAFGHLSEADNLLRSEALRKTMTLGTTFATSELNVIDDPTEEGHSGSFVYDDEGVKSEKSYLIRDGKLAGRLHSRATSGLTGEPLTGHFRAKNYAYTPIIRMGNIYIDTGKDTYEDIISSTKNGLYLFGTAGGQTSGDMFTFAVQGGYKIEDGKITSMVRDIILTGNLFTTLKNIDKIGNTRTMSKGGGCGKGGQILRTSCKGSPYIRIKGMSVGGK